MNLIPYNYFVYINYLVFVVVGVSSWLLSSTNNSINIFLSLLGFFGFLVLMLSKEKQFPSFEYIPTRIVQLVIFVASVLISFSHYFFQVDNNSLILLVLIAPMITLLTLIFVATEDKTQN